jgi:alkaline phosphatase D
MVGHVTSTNARLWTKASGPGRVAVRIGSVPDLSDARVVQGSKVSSQTAFASTLLIENLKPVQRYFYCVLLNGKPAMLPAYPSFTTPLPEDQTGHVRFAFTSCVGNHGYDSTAGFADMARTNFDLLLMLGDNVYSNTNNPEVQRKFYADQRTTAGWREVASRLPIYAIWDDHDFGPDNSDGTLPGKEHSLQTFHEVWANPSYGEPHNPGVYFKFTRANVGFFLLDDRYHRDPNKATNLVHKTMLGDRQLAWLKRELLASRAAVKVLACGSEWQSHGTEDSWTSFRREREDIFNFIEEHHITGVLLISGDRHFTAAYQVKGKWIEVTAGPIGSANSDTKNLPEMFLNFSGTKAKFYCIYDIDTTASPAKVTLEVYRVGEGLATRRSFTWEEVLGLQKIPTLPPPATTEVKTNATKKSQ